ncbi:MAG: GGDEF domain-containing protein [Alcanivorax sp.]|nr:GGDEF domain-containing protein [Alcanivorax sp.]
MPAADRNPLPITDLLDWSDRDKSLLLSVLTGLLMLGFLGWLLFTLRYTRFGEQFLSVQGAGLARDIFLFNVIGWLLLICWGIALHKGKRHSVVYPNVCIHFFGFSFLGVGYVMGLYNPVMGLVLVGSPLTGFILFDFKRVTCSLVIHTIMVLAIYALIVQGKLQYAPLLKADPVTKDLVSVYWVNSMIAFATPFLAIVFGFTYVLLRRWQIREKQIRALAVTDPLTGLDNRRALFDQFSYELARSRRSGSPVSVCVMDLDHFKQINDRYGHVVGDQVLLMVAEVLRDCLRETDRIGRIGGEEFMLLMPETDQQGAQKVIERCRQRLNDTPVEVEGQAPFHISASFGVTCAGPGDTLGEEQLFTRAYQALYQAKEAGRNRMAFWSLPEEAVPA